MKRKTVFVQEVKGRVMAAWTGGSGEVHTRVLQRIRQALIEDTHYPYLQPQAWTRLQSARQLARNAGLAQRNVVSLAADEHVIFPWMGTKACRTLHRCLTRVLEWDSSPNLSPYAIFVSGQRREARELASRIKELVEAEIPPELLLAPDEDPQVDKYDPFLPSELLHKAFAQNHFDVDEMQAVLQTWD